MRRRRVAVLGAGIMGSAVAIHLARRGLDVTVLDRESAPMSAASRWNEGKIHLGYFYGADPTLATAQHLLTGGLLFGDRLRELIDEDLAGHATTEDDIYLVHRDSVVGPDILRPKFEAISELIRVHPDAGRYLVDVGDARATEIARDELAHLAGPDVVAGFRVPERSVETRWVADRLAGALSSQAGVTVRTGTDVVAVEPTDGRTGSWRVRTADGEHEEADLVVNALWDGRLAIDATAGLAPQPPWTHRYRRCLFVRTRRAHELPSALVAVGPFGDIKNYNGREFYLSWYPVGLVAETSDVVLAAPDPLDVAEAADFTARVRAGLEPLMPGIGSVLDDAESVLVHGGFVFARGAGALDDPRSGLHRRDRYGVQRHGNYYSVDTGKYSTAPWLARELANEIAG
ncbi:glycine/D-amino acid oxidase-like deaminating enzyme [Agromyces flavus]|uniref:Glycine/D-amino acid oxidase n=1 Tax=Agromyces flavus TaxID=589382 RepID=A0A1H1V0Q1_9MICO|nr:FAD-dependent oxidoreductase [Agromyces flavus]MCP2368103.1 glycine/D-amino acid oxidase-like deaminating enzyme [Agromyces flavus]SDS77936.1 Glycine/D-amino acid oxidase [Agromyces flavus]